jgi:hypothetical protein
MGHPVYWEFKRVLDIELSENISKSVRNKNTNIQINIY